MFKNSYVVAIIAFILLCVVFYLLGIGYTTIVEYSGEPGCLEKGNCTQTKLIKKFSWKYPLAIALIIWIIWHFYLYPPAEISRPIINFPSQKGGGQKISMTNWN